MVKQTKALKLIFLALKSKALFELRGIETMSRGLVDRYEAIHCLVVLALDTKTLFFVLETLLSWSIWD